MDIKIHLIAKCMLYSHSIGTIASSMTRINGCLCDSKEDKMQQSVSLVSYFSQLIPEAYLTAPLLFPFPPTSHNILGTSALHGITENGQLVSRILPNECCWFAKSGHAITKIPDSLVTYAALLDYSNDSNERKWIRQKATIAHPMEFPILLGNQSMDCERIISDRARRNYVIVNGDETRDRDIRREQGSEAVNLKVDRDHSSDSLVGLSSHESNEKKN